MTVRTRFAPSPTGFLHIGGARTALYNWLFARHHGGTFLLRIEDTDTERSTQDSIRIILDGLRWLKLDWDEGPDVGGPGGPYFQSERTAIYDRYLARLEAAGLAYEDDGAIRFRVPDRTYTVNDIVCGEVSTNLKVAGSRRYDAELGREVDANPDFVIRRPNGGYIFHFVNVIDDLEMGITHVMRGEDHLSNTPKHLALFEAFNATPPQFAHIPLNLNPSGSKMSKRDQGALIHEYQEAGFLPEGVDNYMALLGWSPKEDKEIFSLSELVERFDLKGINRSNSKFDYEKCRWVNAEHLRHLPTKSLEEFAAPFLDKAGIDPNDSRIPRALELAKDRVQVLADIPGVISVIFNSSISWDSASVEKVISRANIKELIQALRTAFGSDALEWTEHGLHDALSAAATGIGAKLGALMLPCRVAIMGQATGVDLIPALALIGRDATLHRLSDFVDQFVPKDDQQDS